VVTLLTQIQEPHHNKYLLLDKYQKNFVHKQDSLFTDNYHMTRVRCLTSTVQLSSHNW